MSGPSALHQRVHARLREVFGEPDTSLGRDDHWGLSPAPSTHKINVLVNGTDEFPAIWVFDPNLPGDGVFRKSIISEDDLDEMIRKIQDRLNQAASK